MLQGPEEQKLCECAGAGEGKRAEKDVLKVSEQEREWASERSRA